MDIQTEVMLRVIPTFIQERDTRTHTDVIPSYKKEIQTHRSNTFIQDRDTHTYTHRCANAALFSKHYSHSTLGNSTFYNQTCI
jgi:hypothetical protein